MRNNSSYGRHKMEGTKYRGFFHKGKGRNSEGDGDMCNVGCRVEFDNTHYWLMSSQMTHAYKKAQTIRVFVSLILSSMQLSRVAKTVSSNIGQHSDREYLF